MCCARNSPCCAARSLIRRRGARSPSCSRCRSSSVLSTSGSPVCSAPTRSDADTERSCGGSGTARTGSTRERRSALRPSSSSGGCRRRTPPGATGASAPSSRRSRRTAQAALFADSGPGGVATVGYIRTGPEGVATPAHCCDQDFRVEAKGLEPSNLLTASQK